MKTSELNAIHAEIAALRSGKLAPTRAWKLEKLPDGSVRRIALKPETVRKANADKEAARLAQDARAALKVTQKDFATLLGVSLRTLHQWEQGRRKPTGAALTLLRVARSNPRAVMKAVSA
ncbi:MAG: helix-turn-helix domain-containing protein [Verrucomicrobiaceae bacterium]|nr:helix-turn-helix domain-containing protein [Verrucomicrobiaceae bacterium]